MATEKRAGPTRVYNKRAWQQYPPGQQWQMSLEVLLGMPHTVTLRPTQSPHIHLW